MMDLEIATGYGECSVCFEHLCTNGAVVMTDGSPQRRMFRQNRLPARVCRHFLCQECAPTIAPRLCPVCRASYAATLNVPDPLVDPMMWFHIIDRDQDGKLDKEELVDALKGMFPVEPGALSEVIEMNWHNWDLDHDGSLDSIEFRDRVAPFLEAALRTMQHKVNNEVPDIMTQPAEWFRLWDEDQSGSLDRAEIVRALVKTIPELNGSDGGWLSNSFSSVWVLIDPDNDGQITPEEFMMPDGLHETIVANFCRHRC